MLSMTLSEAITAIKNGEIAYTAILKNDKIVICDKDGVFFLVSDGGRNFKMLSLMIAEQNARSAITKDFRDYLAEFIYTQEASGGDPIDNLRDTIDRALDQYNSDLKNLLDEHKGGS